jgi:hypothetical protein
MMMGFCEKFVQIRFLSHVVTSQEFLGGGLFVVEGCEL